MEWLAEYGYIGLFFGAFLAATLIPLSSDILLVALLATGADPVKAVAAAAVGNWLGGLSSYGLGYLAKWQWLEKWFGVTEAKLERQRARIIRYGSWIALFTWLPLIGDIMAVGLGFYRVSFWKTAVFMFIGKSVRFVMWAILFHHFGLYF
ncbi:MAG: DedA family protein [Rikenellaceae bacterium]|nr:DedA family protein [Rikenellaceae bacterium]MCL2692249.1 DedA family protein [Rikenellaceae bacterium]